jgi:hypothetical protein
MRWTSRDTYVHVHERIECGFNAVSVSKDTAVHCAVTTRDDDTRLRQRLKGSLQWSRHVASDDARDEDTVGVAR